VIEEFQMLRDAVIRLYAEPRRRTLRISCDLLRVNRLIDRGATQSRVGHTDRLFFALFQGRGVSDGLTEENVADLSQLDAIRREFLPIERLRSTADRSRPLSLERRRAHPGCGMRSRISCSQGGVMTMESRLATANPTAQVVEPASRPMTRPTSPTPSLSACPTIQPICQRCAI
jgi:hypothetical protein